jgi:predicted HicB family RNase H-like nuclease
MREKKRPVGRPSKGIRKTVMVKLPPNDHARIKAYSVSHKIDMNALMVQATLKVIEGQTQLDLK